MERGAVRTDSAGPVAGSDPADAGPAPELNDARADDLLASADPGELVAELAHSIRSRLTAVLFTTEALRSGQGGELSAIQRSHLAHAYGAALAASALASSVTELVRGPGSLDAFEPTPFLVSDLLESVRTSIAPIAEARELDLEVTPPDPDLRLGHRLALERALLGLAMSVLEFTDEGFVEVAARPTGPTTLALDVHGSTGPIDAETLHGLARPIHPRESGGGIRWSLPGAAIASARALARSLGGELRVEVHGAGGMRLSMELELPPG